MSETTPPKNEYQNRWALEKVNDYKKPDWLDHTMSRRRTNGSFLKPDQITLELSLDGGENYVPNISYLDSSKKKQAKYFLLDRNEMELIAPSFQQGDELLSLENYAKYSKARVVVRAMSFFWNQLLIYAILVDDAFEVASIFLKRAGKSVADIEELLQPFREKWGSNNVDFSESMPVESFKGLMDLLNVDRDQIVIVPDLVHELSRFKSLLKTGSYVSTIGRNGEVVMNSHYAMFYIFKTLFCGRNWYYKKEVHAGFKKAFTKALAPLKDLELQVFVSKQWIDSTIESVQKEKILEMVPQDNDFEFFDYKPDDFITYEQFLQLFIKYGLAPQSLPDQKVEMQVWMANIYLIVGFVRSLCPVGIWVKLIHEAVHYKYLPGSDVRRRKFMIKQNNKTKYTDFKNYLWAKDYTARAARRPEEGQKLANKK